MVRKSFKKAFSRGGTIRGHKKLLLTSGFPCQDVSNAGECAGIAGERSGLWGRVRNAIRMVRPEYVVVENVAGLLNRGMGTVLGDLAGEGYNAEWNCLSSSSHGAPHERKRIITVATDPECVRQSGSWGCLNAIHPEEDSYREASWLVDAFQREALPYVCGRHDVSTDGMDQERLMALGNAVDLNVCKSAIKYVKDIEG